MQKAIIKSRNLTRRVIKVATRTTKTTKTAKSTRTTRTRKPKKLTLTQQAKKILEQAEERGISSNFFFATTFQRYQVQMDILKNLENEIKRYGTTVKKEYVKGRENLVANPAITEYNKTATAANGTVSTLINILKTLSNEADSVDALTEFLKNE